MSQDDIFESLRVLVVDDEDKAVAAVSSWLIQKGADVRRALTAADALEALHQWQPQIVWLDIYLEAGSERLERRLKRMAHEHWGGVLLLEELPRLRPQPDLIVATGSIGNVMSVKAIAGFDFELLGKPLDLAQAISTLRRLAERHR